MDAEFRNPIEYLFPQFQGGAAILENRLQEEGLAWGPTRPSAGE